MILGDFLKALGQFGDPRFRRVVWLGLGLALVLLAGAYGLVAWGVHLLAPAAITLPLIGEVQWVGSLLSVASLVLMFVLSAFLMVPVASAFSGLFLDDVAQAVEDRFYPALPDATPLPLAEALVDSAQFLAVILAVNLLGLVMLPFAGPLVPLIWWAINGFLLGREYFQLAATRRIGRAGARALRARHSGQIWLAGVLMAVPLSVPLVNLLVPVLAAATFTHLFHRLAPLPRG